MNKSTLLGIIFALSTVHAKNNEHRHHEAHVHGEATLSIAFDQQKGKIEFQAASEGILGFEHEAKSEKDKKRLSATIGKFETSMTSMIKFDDSLGCVFNKEKVEMVAEKEAPNGKEKNHKEHKGEHSNFIANYIVDCNKSPKGTKITFDFTSFNGLKDLDVTLLVDDFQKSVEVKRKPITVELK